MNFDLSEVMPLAWRVSPLATATYMSAFDGESPRFESAEHLRLISDKIVAAALGFGKKKLIFSMPPRHGKSTQVTRWTPEWFLANYPHLTVGMCGYGSEFANEWGRMVRNQMAAHSELSGIKLADDSKKANVWHTGQGGGMWTAGIRGTITGRGADLLIIDDPIKNEEEAFSLLQRDKLWNWWQLTAQSRTYPHSVTIIVMTRWHSDDLVGRLLSREYPGPPEDWEVVELPAIWEEDEPDVLGRKKGEALWESHFSAEWLVANRKNTMLPEHWLSLYQQFPSNKSGLGAVYSNFSESGNVREVLRDPRLPIAWSLDFNVNPMTSVIAQVREETGRDLHDLLSNRRRTSIEVLDEIVLPHSKTLEMCSEFEARLEKLLKNENSTPEILVYGDATANRRDTRGDESDWKQVFDFLRKRGVPFQNFVTKANPTERARANSVNLALKAPTGVANLIVDPRCKELRIDLKEVRWKKDASGNTTSQLDKSDPKRTHVSDALGYLVYGKMPVIAGGGEMSLSGIVR